MAVSLEHLRIHTKIIVHVAALAALNNIIVPYSGVRHYNIIIKPLAALHTPEVRLSQLHH